MPHEFEATHEKATTVPIALGNGVTAHAVIRGALGETQVGDKLFDLDKVMAGVAAMTARLRGAISAASPQKVSVEFSVDLTMESGKLAALFFDAEGKSGLKIRLEW